MTEYLIAAGVLWNLSIFVCILYVCVYEVARKIRKHRQRNAEMEAEVWLRWENERAIRESSVARPRARSYTDNVQHHRRMESWENDRGGT